jgi:hypothetical protein
VTNYSQLAADINAANTNGGTNTITLGANIQLTSVDNNTNGTNGLPVIASGDQLTFIGNGYSIARSTASGTPAFRLFDVAGGSSLILQNLTLQGGLANGWGAAAEGGAIYSSGTLTFSGVTVQNNKAVGANGGLSITGNGSAGGAASGGGVYAVGAVTLSNDVFTNNEAVGGLGGKGQQALNFTDYLQQGGDGGAGGAASGGGLFVAGGNGIHGATYPGYWAGSGGSGGAAWGGGLYVAEGNVTLTNDTLGSNEAVAGNGGNGGSGQIGSGTEGTIGSGAGGSGGAASGGGVDVAAGTVTLINDTLSGNQAVAGNGGNGGSGIYLGGAGGNGGNGGNGNGGGLAVGSSAIANLTNTLIALNTTTAGTAGAAGSASVSKSGTAGSASAPDVSSTVASSDHDLIGNSSGSSGFSTTNGDILNPSYVGLGALQNNGGLTLTMALLPGSPAIDAGDSSVAALPAHDQRGYNRIADGAVDIGAYEAQGFILSLTSGNNQSTLFNTAFANPLVVTVTAQDGIDPVADGQLTFTPPTGGASAALSPANPVTIAADGTATVYATANGTGGSYQVTANTAGASAPVAFDLTNQSTTVTLNNATATYGAASVTLNADITSGGVGVTEGTVTFTVLQNGNPIGKATATSSFDSNGNVSVSYALPAGLTVSSYTVEADYSDIAGKFAAASGQASLTINPDPLTIAANNETIIQGEALPPFTISYSGFVLGEGPSVLGGTPTFSTTATSSSPPGTYAIIPSGLTASNYAITFVSGTLTILSYSQATANLQAQVDTAGLGQGTQSSLDTQLQEAAALFQASNTTAGVNVLEAFIHHVSAQSGKHIDAALADVWIANAQQIINAVG